MSSDEADDRQVRRLQMRDWEESVEDDGKLSPLKWFPYDYDQRITFSAI